MELKLLKKYFENKCTPEEAGKVLEWIESSDAFDDLEPDFGNAWKQIKVNPGNNYKWSKNLDKVHDKIEMEDLYGSLKVHKGLTKPIQKFRDRSPISRKEKRTYRLYTARRKILLSLVALLIILPISLLILSHNYFGENESVIGLAEKVTEKGQKLSFHLDDGTKVILNANSKLFYPSEFGEFERKVELVGEAFFEVTKEANRPFRVEAGRVITTALGTSFNITAFPENDSIEIALVSGKVSVNNTIESGGSNYMLLSAGEMAAVARNDFSITKTTFDLNQKISWKDGLIYFKDCGFQEIIHRLENWYGVEIRVDRAPATEWKFSGKFEDETLENILIALQFGHNFEFEINGKEVILNF